MNIKILLWPLLLVSYIFILSINLLKLPLYLDEGLYIFWSYLFSENQGFAYISMQDGKTPLFIWLTAFLNPLFSNFLFTGRFISVVASAISLICCLVITAKIIGKKALLFVFIIFLVTPFNVLISRLAFVDSLLIAFSSLSILGIFLLRESVANKQFFRGLLFAILAGIFLALGFFTKTTAKIFLATEILILVIWVLQFLKGKDFKAAFFLATFSALAIGLYFELVGYLKFGSLRHWEMIANKETILVFSLQDLYRLFWVEKNFAQHLKNIPVYLEYLLFYFGPILLFFISGTFWMLKQKKHLWILLTVIILAAGVFLSAKIPASRYLTIIIPEVLIISSFGFYWIWQKKSPVLKIGSVILLIISGFISSKMILDPINAYYSSDDAANFVDYNLNALGINESIEFLQPRKDLSVVGVTGTWGVSEGAYVRLKERGIETYQIKRFVESHPKEKPVCEKDFSELENKCWKIDFGDLYKNPKERYIYLVSEDVDINTLKRLTPIEVVKEFVREKTHLNVYLIKLM